MSQPGSWVTVAVPRPHARVRLLCFPHAGGSSVAYHGWSVAMPPHIEVCAVELPGRGTRFREPLRTEMRELASEAQQGLQPWMNAPFALFGHSLGASLCYELARRLERDGGPRPLRLFVSGRRAPHRPRPGPIIHRLPDDQFVEELRQLQGTPDGVLENPELMELFLPILRADFQLGETYSLAAPEPLDCPLSAYGGVQDTEVSHDELQEWRRYTNADFQLRPFPGNHFFVNSCQDMVVAAIVDDLAAAMGDAVV